MECAGRKLGSHHKKKHMRQKKKKTVQRNSFRAIFYFNMPLHKLNICMGQTTPKNNEPHAVLALM